MKVSIITVVYNGEKYIDDCLSSVMAQDYGNIEYIVIDGGSTDQTLTIIDRYRDRIAQLVSEKDKGMYDALNKGISLATGEVLGILNADDMLASPQVISKMVERLVVADADGVYGNLNYIHPETGKIIRKWISKPFTKRAIELGWMPAHPTLYLKRELFERYGNYSLNFGTAADYELMLRFLYRYQVKAVFLDELMVNMRVGGMSNASMKHRYHALVNDYRALKANQVPISLLTLAFKKLSKISQFLLI
ncbi:glycosyltransferase family 2 protein [Pedobacter sp. KR3-3]|uniref:Glycosyltransferase family 2 protein n=1 Tax=Pedobacter albus TaxID=3113905 RepID=A0ABU7I6K7_9SPHI|nr:glycosyltransferase family 2 protein [Pedobacter sp. KR3-3]MEE1945117.1 glycosyltransferase family 2 protein [Pedobacter sp. KR3-3]